MLRCLFAPRCFQIPDLPAQALPHMPSRHSRGTSFREVQRLPRAVPVLIRRKILCLVIQPTLSFHYLIPRCTLTGSLAAHTPPRPAPAVAIHPSQSGWDGTEETGAQGQSQSHFRGPPANATVGWYPGARSCSGGHSVSSPRITYSRTCPVWHCPS